MKEIGLTRGKITMVDDEDYGMLSKYKWCVTSGDNILYAKRGFYDKNTKKIISIFMHRVIMNTPNGYQVDHIDGNGLNNLKSNLRNVLPRENKRNRKLNKNNKLGYKGVYLIGKNKYVARIYVGGIHIYLGIYKTSILAALAYDMAAQRYHGEYSRLNF